MSRSCRIERKTNETNITVEMWLDGTGESTIDTGIGFLNHMLTLMAKHSQCDINVICKGDLEVDSHHTVEDVGIVMGQAIIKSLGDKAGITRYGTAFVPMDEALVMTALDISGRGSLFCNLEILRELLGSFDTEMTREFFAALTSNAGINAHIRQLDGENSHHIIEAAFKSFARALRQAVTIDPRVQGVPSTKGVL